jgi:hypothetical protein
MLARLAATGLVACWLLSVAPLACAAPQPAAGVGFQPRTCPDGVPANVRCHATQDALGSWVLAALPEPWNGELVVHAHGGPSLDEPTVKEIEEDLQRYAGVVAAGYAWVGSTYRSGGFAVRRAATDVEASRQLFLGAWGAPRHTWLHGQSWGAQVAIKVHELHGRADDGQARYAGVLLTNGVVQGASRAYQFRADLRAVYQYYCRNHPAADEPAYPLWQGLPAGSRLTRKALDAKIDECTGADRPAGQRTAEQSARLRNIATAVGIREDQLARHLGWATFTFRSLVAGLDGRNPFDNRTRRYAGTTDDEALNRDVQRFDADPAAVARLAWDGDPTGQWLLPTLSLHAVADPVATVSAERVLADIVGQAGNARLLVQLGLDSDNHGRQSAAVLVAALQGLRHWVERQQVPDLPTLQHDCQANAANAAECNLRHLP